MEYLKDLNAEQLVAVAAVDGYVRVVAGAGSGKTRALTTRYAYLMDAVGVSPDKILCVTFTNKAANAMKDKVRSIVGEEVELNHIQTFHGFCNYFLRREIGNLKLRKGYKIMDSSDQKAVIKSVIELLGLKVSDFDSTGACLESVIGAEVKCKEDFEPYVEYLMNTDVATMWQEVSDETDNKEMIAKGYLAEQKSNNALDYEDLINFTLYILRHNAEVRERWQNRFEYIQIDEFQDVNDKELEIVGILSAKKRNLFVVGDPDQCLYSFRGANVRCIVDFDKKLTEILKAPIKSITLYLNTNYRSTPEITKMANSLIRHNTIRLDKDLVPVKQSGLIAEHKNLADAREEADYIADIIIKNKKEGYNYRDIAILYRINSLSRLTEQALFQRGIPYTVVKGTAFYARKEIKDILAIMSLICYGDDLSLIRLFKEIRMGIGVKKIMTLQFLANDEGSSMYEALLRHINDTAFKKAKDFTDNILNLTDLYKKFEKNPHRISILLEEIRTVFDFAEVYKKEPERLDNINELQVAVGEYEKLHANEDITLEGYLEEISLFSTVEDNDDGQPADKVQLMTIHAAKGLEFPVVIVAGMNQGILPYAKALNSELSIEEERRISYVAMTRAENKLYLTSNSGFGYNRDGSCMQVSQFMYEIPSSFFKTNIAHKDEKDAELSRLIKTFNSEAMIAIGQLSNAQIEHYLKTHRLLNHYSTYHDACEFTNELEVKLLRFMRTLSDKAFDEWFSIITEDTYKDIFAGDFGIPEDTISSDNAVNILLNGF